MRQATPEDFVGRKVVSANTRSINQIDLTFDDGELLSLSVECIHPTIGLYGIVVLEDGEQ